MADMKQIEIALIEKRKAALLSAIMPLLAQIKQLIPDFTAKDNYVAQIKELIDKLLADPQLAAAILDIQCPALIEAICTDLTPARLAELGLEDICL
jgi:hypothetical protein